MDSLYLALPIVVGVAIVFAIEVVLKKMGKNGKRRVKHDTKHVYEHH